MSDFNFSDALERARSRWDERPSARRVRKDRGQGRLAPEVQAELSRLLLGLERPPMTAVLRQLRQHCAERGLRPPARATLYAALDTLPVAGYEIASLPDAVRATLHNLSPSGRVPGPQLAFHCFNYGTLPAMSWAAGLPWLTLLQASRKRGWRPGSQGVLEAVLAARRITR